MPAAVDWLFKVAQLPSVGIVGNAVAVTQLSFIGGQDVEFVTIALSVNVQPELCVRVHLTVTAVLAGTPLTFDVAELLLEKEMPVQFVMQLQAPVNPDGKLADIVNEEVLHSNWSAPALAVGDVAYEMMI